MSMALSFKLGAIVLMLLVLVIILTSLWRGFKRGTHTGENDAQQQGADVNAQFYRDQLAELEQEFSLGQITAEELRSSQQEISHRVLEDMRSAPSASSEVAPVSTQRLWLLSALIVLVLPIASISMYTKWGQPQALDPDVVRQGIEQEQMTPEKLTQMVTALTRRLQDDPNSVEGWVLLGRVQSALGHFDEASDALGRALQLTQDDDLQLERAEILSRKNGGSFAGEPWAVIQKVLTANPHQVNALMLAGSASFSELNYQAALKFWERAREVVPAESTDAASLDDAIAQARNKLGLPAAPAHAKASAEKALPGQSIRGRVSLVDELKSKVSPKDTVFVYATTVGGSRMPLAIIKTTVDQLPLDFVLDDSQSMKADAKLSSQREVSVTARISRTGQAIPQPGDLGVMTTPVKLGTRDLDLMIRESLN